MTGKRSAVVLRRSIIFDPLTGAGWSSVESTLFYSKNVESTQITHPSTEGFQSGASVCSFTAFMYTTNAATTSMFWSAG